MSEIRKQKRNNRRSLPGLLPVRPSQLAGPASQPSPPPPSSSWRQSARRVAGARARPERHATSSSACLPRQRDAAALLLGAAPIPWPYPSLSPVLLPLSLSRPNTTVAAVRHSSRLRPPLAPPTSSEAPPRPLFLPTAPRSSGSPASPPCCRSPLRAPTIVTVEFVVSSASPSPLTIPAAPR